MGRPGGADQGTQPATPTWSGPVLSASVRHSSRHFGPHPQERQESLSNSSLPSPQTSPFPQASISTDLSGMCSLLAPPGPGEVD